MRTRTYVKYARNLTRAEYDECWQKNLGNTGVMRHELVKSWRNRESQSKAVLIKDADTGNIIAWSLTDARHRGNTGVMFWVEPAYRRRGFGDRLMRHSKKVDPRPYVFPHDERSASFFGKHLQGVRLSRYDREDWY